MNQKVVFSTDIEQHLKEVISAVAPDRLFVLCDTTTAELCLPLIQPLECMHDAQPITIEAGDTAKTLESLSHVWQSLQKGGATRHSMLVNLGGGMVTDLGGFAASTFKRGIHFVNIPTTLLSMVDASVGGKTGINFGGLKNEIGVFRNADVVILDTKFLSTLDRDNLLSGYAEMLKHGLISDAEMLSTLLAFDVEAPDYRVLQSMLEESVAVKQRIVTEDPLEHGIRRALNLGHTIGHSFESYAMSTERPILHGYAVAYGLICELYLSCVKQGFPTETLRQVVHFVNEHYGRLHITCDDYPALVELMTHDKKNVADTINFTLLSSVGEIKIDQIATQDEILEALDFYRENQ